MRRVCCFILCLIMMFSSCIPAFAAETGLKKVVVLDPGHGGDDPGAEGNGFLEKDLNWDITIACKEELEKFGITVYLSREREKNPSLADRAKVAKEKNADVLVSIHNNSFTNSTAKGTEVYHSVKSSKRFYNLAEDVLDNFVSDMGTTSRGVKTRYGSSGTDDYYGIIRNCDRPAILVECVFITNSQDVGKISDAEGRIKAGKAIAHGILEQYGIDWTIEPKPPAEEVTEEITEEKTGEIITKEMTFEDLATESWYYPYVQKVFEKGLIKGYFEDGKWFLKPENNATRIESAIFVLKHLGVDVSGFEDVSLPYEDFSENQRWAENYIKAAFELGVMKGELKDEKLYLNGDNGITRAEFFAMMARALMISDNDESYKETDFSKFSDKEEIEKLPWFENEFKYLIYNNIVIGTDGRFEPNNDIKRCEIIKMLAVS